MLVCMSERVKKCVVEEEGRGGRRPFFKHVQGGLKYSTRTSFLLVFFLRYLARYLVRPCQLFAVASLSP